MKNLTNKTMKQTAVEWLQEALSLTFEQQMQFEGLFQQAKEMEKQQLIDCGNSCAIKQHIHIEKVNKMSMDEMLEFSKEETLTFGEEYYNESFKK